jgi:hypothetical protein
METDRERFINSFKNWAPVTPQSPVSREDLRRQLHEDYRSKTGSATLADVAVEAEARKGNERVQLERKLKPKHAGLEAGIEAFRRDTVRILAPYEAKLRTAEQTVIAANAALEAKRIERAGELAAGLAKERDEILAELRRPFDIAERVIPWREGGVAPTFPPGT